MSDYNVRDAMTTRWWPIAALLFALGISPSVVRAEPPFQDINLADNSDGRLELFLLGSDGAAYHRWQITANGCWGDVAQLQGHDLRQLAAAINQDGRLELFALGADGAAYHRWQATPNGVWGGWFSLQGHDLRQIAAATNQDGRLELFALGADGAAYHRWQITPNGGWGEWSGLQGHDLRQIAAATNQDGRLELFALGADGAAYHRWQTTPNGGWGEWATLQGHDLKRLAATRNSDGRLELFTIGADKSVYHIWQTTANGGWGTWVSLQGHDLQQIAAGRNQDGRVEIESLGADGVIYQRWQQTPGSGAWRAWAAMAACATPPVAAGADADHDGIPDAMEAELLQRFSPYLMYSYDHGAEEHYNPIDPLDYIRQSKLLTATSSSSPAWFSTTQLQNPTTLLSADKPDDPASKDHFGSSDLAVSAFATSGKHQRTNYRLKPVTDAATHGAAWPTILAAGNTGLFGHVSPFVAQACTGVAPDGSRLPPRGRWEEPWDPVTNPGGCRHCAQIEYYQYFGYNNAAAIQDLGDHEGDWAILTVIYETDPGREKLLAVSHWAHGYEMRFDLTQTVASSVQGEVKELRGPRYDPGSFKLAKFKVPIWDGIEADEPQKAQNNGVSFRRDVSTGLFTHPVVYVEYGGHEFWPTPHWEFAGAPKHGGDGKYFYLTHDVPNLGEVEYPSTEEARIITHYNGYWGTYNNSNDNPPGPALHKSWNWPDAAPPGSLPTFIKSEISPKLTCDDKE